MSKPGEGESLTTGEAAAYARGRAAGLRDAADAIQCSGCGSVAAVLALLDGAAAGDAREPDIEEWRAEERATLSLCLDRVRDQRDAARARVAELEWEVAQIEQANETLYRMSQQARCAGAEAMREAAAKEVGRERNVEWFTSETNGVHLKCKGETEFMRRGEVIRMRDEIYRAIRALPLPQEAGGE